MAAFKQPTFQDRATAAQAAREKALEKLRNRPVQDEETIARKLAQQQAREEAAAEASRLKKEARDREREERRLMAAMIAEEEAQKAAEEEARRQVELEAKMARMPKQLTDEEKKAARDARYAARKLRVMRGR